MAMTPLGLDPDQVAADALATMRMSPTDPDAPRVTDAALSSCELIARYLGDTVVYPEAPQPIQDAAVLVTVELYRRKDAAFGVLNTWATSDFGPVRISTDWLKGVESMLHPFMRDSYGVG